MRVSARILLFIALLLPATGSAAPAFTLRTCLENSDSYPWLLQSGEGNVQYHLKAGATAEIRLSDQNVKLITFGRADQFQAIDQKLRKRQ